MVFTSIRALRLFLRARAVIKFVLQAASALENTDGEQRALHKFLLIRISLLCLLLKANVILRRVNWLTPPKRDNSSKARHSFLLWFPTAYSQ